LADLWFLAPRGTGINAEEFVYFRKSYLKNPCRYDRIFLRATAPKTNKGEYKPMKFDTPIYPGAMTPRQMLQQVKLILSAVAVTVATVATFAYIAITLS
jgi:hypothetical protein